MSHVFTCTWQPNNGNNTQFGSHACPLLVCIIISHDDSTGRVSWLPSPTCIRSLCVHENSDVSMETVSDGCIGQQPMIRLAYAVRVRILLTIFVGMVEKHFGACKVRALESRILQAITKLLWCTGWCLKYLAGIYEVSTQCIIDVQ